MKGAKVSHKMWGKGTVVTQTDSKIIIHFSVGDKQFVFPDAFDNYLSTSNATLLKEIAAQKAKNVDNTPPYRHHASKPGIRKT